jgi:hypothetical protein
MIQSIGFCMPRMMAIHRLATLLDPSISILMTASLHQNKLAIVDPVSGRPQIAAMDSLLVAPMALYAPEIQEVARSGDARLTRRPALGAERLSARITYR